MLEDLVMTIAVLWGDVNAQPYQCTAISMHSDINVQPYQCSGMAVHGAECRVTPFLRDRLEVACWVQIGAPVSLWSTRGSQDLCPLPGQSQGWEPCD